MIKKKVVVRHKLYTVEELRDFIKSGIKKGENIIKSYKVTIMKPRLTRVFIKKTDAVNWARKIIKKTGENL